MRLHPGEVEASHWRVETLGSVLRQLTEIPPQVTGRPRIIAIDGRGGAGKTVLVGQLQRAVAASAVVHTDDIAWNHACFDWAALLTENVLQPLLRGEGVHFRPPAWAERGRSGTIDVPAGLDVVWVEGTGVIRRELASVLDASIYVQGDLDVQERRLVARDGDSPEQREHIARWMEEELPFMAREQPWASGTIVVDGASDLVHDPDTELVVAPPVRG